MEMHLFREFDLDRVRRSNHHFSMISDGGEAHWSLHKLLSRLLGNCLNAHLACFFIDNVLTKVLVDDVLGGEWSVLCRGPGARFGRVVRSDILWSLNGSCLVDRLVNANNLLNVLVNWLLDAGSRLSWLVSHVLDLSALSLDTRQRGRALEAYRATRSSLRSDIALGSRDVLWRNWLLGQLLVSFRD